MKRFVCDFVYTQDVTQEVITLFLRYKQRFLVYEMGLLSLLLFFSGVAIKNNKIFACGFLPIAFFIFIKIQNKKAIKSEIERQKPIFSSDRQYYHIEIEDGINFVSDGKTKTIELSNVEKILEGETLYCIVLLGGILVPLLKTGFIEGDAEECIDLLKARTKK